MFLSVINNFKKAGGVFSSLTRNSTDTAMYDMLSRVKSFNHTKEEKDKIIPKYIQRLKSDVEITGVSNDSLLKFIDKYTKPFDEQLTLSTSEWCREENYSLIEFYQEMGYLVKPSWSGNRVHIYNEKHHVGAGMYS